MGSEKKQFRVRAFVLVATMAAAYVVVAALARNLKELDPGGGSAGYDGTPRPPRDGPPGAPTQVQVARLHDALRAKLGTNARGLSRVTHLDYDGWPDRLHVVMALDTPPAPGEAPPDVQPMREILHHLHGAGLQWSWVLVSATAPLPGPDNQATEATVVRALFPRDKLDRLDWPRVTDADLPPLAERFTFDASAAASPSPAGSGAQSTKKSK